LQAAEDEQGASKKGTRRLLKRIAGEGMVETTSVVTRYEAIFDKDPILLDKQNQNTYFESFLRHLFINRSARDADYVRLNEPTEPISRGKAKPPVTPPSKHLVSRYEEMRRCRDKLSKVIFDRLKPYTLVFNPYHTRKRTAGIYGLHGRAVSSLRKKPSSLDNRLRIAAIGYRVGLSTIQDENYFGEELCVLPKPEVRLPDDLREQCDVNELARTKLVGDRARWEKDILDRIALAFKRKPHVVVLPELALPPSLTGQSDHIESQIEKLTLAKGGDDVLVFAGTRHESIYNRGLLISKMAGEIRRRWHYKLAPARKMGENTLASQDVRVPVYVKTFKIGHRRQPTFEFMIAVCYDAFDPTVFLTLLKKAVENTKVFEHLFILVPSFNRSDDFVALLRDLSFLGRCCVLYVNGLHGDARLYMYGFSVSELLEKQDNIIVDIDQLLIRLRQEIEAEDERWAKLIDSNTNAERDPALLEKRNDNLEMENALRGFKSDIETLKEEGGLRHLVTVEQRPRRPDQAGTTKGDDILYYNIDLRLLATIKKYRAEFFLDDKHLPAPLTFRELSRLFIRPETKPDF
jgi:hypothetical protein